MNLFQPLDSGKLFDSYRECGGAASVSDADADASPSSPSSSCLTPDSPSPPPTTADFCEFLQLQLQLDGGNGQNGNYRYGQERKFVCGINGCGGSLSSGDGSEADLSRLTLSDREQRELYQAARMIQKAYRSYKGRQRQEEAERHAAVLIQQYYRRHKQCAYYRYFEFLFSDKSNETLSCVISIFYINNRFISVIFRIY